MLVCLVNEYKSSATCNHYRGLTKAEGRSLICLNSPCGGVRTEDQNTLFGLSSSTEPMRDRDHNAALNLARVRLQQVQTQCWPVEMQRAKAVDLEDLDGDGVAASASAELVRLDFAKALTPLMLAYASNLLKRSALRKKPPPMLVVSVIARFDMN
ncbi:hypothetical protein BGW42_002008 [Actinomortierella wolfii]|nr:hypothetical protein BGW42_002008 [Actinomortierella wolfii]